MFFRTIFLFLPKFKKSYYRLYNRLYFSLFGVKYGNNLRVYNKVYLSGKGNIKIGDDFTLTSGNNINPISRNIYGSIFSRYENSLIDIGNNVSISSPCIWANDRIIIGSNVKIGANCVILDNDAHPHDYIKRRANYSYKKGENSRNLIPTSPVIIEDDVWIGTNCIVLKGAHIGARSIIAAGSVITGKIPSDCIASGIPCKVLKSNK